MHNEATGSDTDKMTLSKGLLETSASLLVSASSRLSEDYIHSASMLASASAPLPLASFLNSSAQSEALLIHDDGELCHLLREPLSGTGWNIVGIGAQINAIIAASSNSMATIGQDNSIWISNAGHWNLVPSLPGDNQSLSACQDGTFFGTSSQGGQYGLYQYDPIGAVFNEVSAIPYSTPPVGIAGNLWTVDSQGEVLYNTTNPITPGIDWTPLDAEIWLKEGDIPGSVFVAPDSSVWIFCPNTTTLYAPDPDGSTWSPCSAPAQLIAVAPLNVSSFYALCVQNDTTALYLCDGMGNNTIVPQPENRTLNSISVGAMDGTLWALDATGVAWKNLNNTWIRMIQPTDLAGTTSGHKVTEVVTGQHAFGSQYAFFVMDGNLYWSVFAEEEGFFGGYWTVPFQVFSGISDIGVVNDPVVNSNLIAYGVSSNGNLVVVQNKGTGWTAVETKMKTSLSGTKPIFNTYNSYWITYAVIDGAFHAGVGQLNAPATTLSSVKSPTPLHSLIPFSTSPQDIDWTLVAGAIDTSNQIWTIQIASANESNFTFGFTSLSAPTTGTTPSAVGMIASETEGARIYATDQSDLLWVIRQTGYSNNAFQWSTWHPLGDECVTLAMGCTLPPPNAANRPPVDLFSLDSGYEVNVLSEDASTGQLTDLIMLKPAGTNTAPEYVSRYMTEVTVTDQNGVPQSNIAISRHLRRRRRRVGRTVTLHYHSRHAHLTHNWTFGCLYIQLLRLGSRQPYLLLQR
jgi:hypothetical protein